MTKFISTNWIWAKWLIYNRRPELLYSFVHNEYVENSNVREDIKPKLAQLLYQYHVYTPHQYKLLEDIGYPRLMSSIPSTPLPVSYETQVGNFVEILASELAKRNGYEIPFLRLELNPNPDQSMKGDDVLGFRFATMAITLNTVLVGEAKFMKDFNTRTVEKAVDALRRSFRPYPISIEFVVNLLSIRGEKQKAEKILQLRQKLTSQSDDVEIKRFIAIACEGKPGNPFEHLESLKDEITLSEYVTTNIVFDENFVSWIREVYEYASQHIDEMRRYAT